MKSGLLALLLLFLLHGCGNSSNPESDLKEYDKVIEAKEIVPVDQNITTTHIRVMELDEKSKIPEYLIKIPIYQN